MLDQLSLSAGWDFGMARRAERRLQTEILASPHSAPTTDEAYVAKIRRLAAYLQGEWAATSSIDTYFMELASNRLEGIGTGWTARRS